MENKKNNNLFAFIVLFFLIIISLSFFSFAENNDKSEKNIFEDFDGDGLSNSEEEAFGTDPNKMDTDNDGYSDGVEIESGYDPLKSASLGDKIVKDKDVIKTKTEELTIDDKNLTQKLSKDLVNYIGDAKESGKKEISTEDLSKMVTDSLKDNMSVKDIQINPKDFKIKKQDYKKLSEKKRKEKEKEDAIEYFTAVSYVFMTNFPEGFFNRGPEDFSAEVLSNAQNFSSDLTQTSYFENLANNAIKAEKDLKEVEVPESLIDIHYQGLYLLKYMGEIYSNKEYKNVNEDSLSMLVTLTKLQGLLEQGQIFMDNVKKVMNTYEITDQFLNF